MPEFITEEQYLAVENIINNPPPGTTDYYMGEWKKHQNRYKEQQFRAGITDLTPNKTAKAGADQFETVKKYNEIYSKGIEGYDVTTEPDGQYLTSPEAIARRVNRNYLSTIYTGEKIDASNHDLVRTDFAKRFLSREDILDDVTFFNAVKDHVGKTVKNAEREQKIQQQAVVNYYEGLSLSDSLKQIQQFGPVDASNVRTIHQNLDSVINPVKPKIDNLLSALSRKTKPEVMKQYATETGKTVEEIKAEDKLIVDDFTNTLIQIHPDNRSKIMKKALGEAARKGKLEQEDPQGIYNETVKLFDEAVKSAKNVFEGYDAAMRMDAEVSLNKMSFAPGDELRSATLTEITTPEQARQYIMTQLRGGEIAPAVGPGARPFIPELNKIQLNENSTKLLRDAKAELSSVIDIDRKIGQLSKAVDPFREGILTDMATTLGSSVGIMGVYGLAGLAGPIGTAGGLSFVGTLYTGLNYDEIREKYPDLSPDKARNVAVASGGVEALLDLGQFSIITKAFKSLGVKEAVDLAGRGAASRFGIKAAETTIKTYIFELGIEFLQEGARPIVQEIFAQYDKEYSINISEEWADWKDAAPHIAIGMIPLAVIGGLGAGSKRIFADSALKKSIMKEGELTAFGLSQEQVVEVQNLVNNNMFDAARSRLQELNKDQNVLERRGDALQRIIAAQGIEEIRAFDEARRDGLIPKYTTNEQNNYVLEDGTILQDQRAYIEYTRSKIEELEIEYANTTKQLIEGGSAEVVDIDELNRRTSLIGRVKGLTVDQLRSYDSIFGTTAVEQSDVVDRLITSIVDKGPVEGIKSYLNEIYDNITEDVKLALGKDKTEGIETLYSIITGQSVAIRDENDMSGVNVVIKPADHIVDYEDVSIVEKNKEVDDTFYLAGLKGFDAARDSLEKNRLQSYSGSGGLNFVNIKGEQTSVGGKYVQTIVNTLEEQYNVRFFFVKGQKNDQGKYVGAYGISVDNAIIIDIDRARGSVLNHVLGHEFAHYLENTSAYKDMSDAIIRFSQKQFDDYRKVHGENTQREFVADMLGSNFRDINFWSKLTGEMYKANPTTADSFIGTVKAYLGGIKEMLPKSLQNREIDTESIQDFDKLQSAIIAGMLKGRADQSQQTGEAKFMEATPSSENRSVDYVSRKLRDQINYAMSRIQEAGGLPVGKEALLARLLTPQTEEQYTDYIENRKSSILRRINAERKAIDNLNIGRTLRNISNNLYTALKDNTTTLKQIAEAEAAKIAIDKDYTPLTLAQIQDIQKNPASKTMEYIETFNKARNEYLTEVVNVKIKYIYDALTGRITPDREDVKEWVKTLRDVIKESPIINNLFNNIDNALFETDIKKIKSELSEVYNELYTAEGVPREMSDEAFLNAMLKYSVYKTFGGWQKRNINEKENVITQALKLTSRAFLDNVQDIFVNPQTEELVEKSIKEIVENKNTIKRKVDRNPLIADTVEGIFSYLDNHITFSSELELISPSVGTPGRPITSELQKVNDMLINAYLNIQDEQIETQQSITSKVSKIFGITEKEAIKIIYDILTAKNKIKVTIKGKSVKLKEGYAAYILNIEDQLIYQDQLNSAGFTTEVLNDIRSQISKEVDALRRELRDDLIKIVKRNNQKLRDIGTFAIDPSEIFFPVQKQSLIRSVVDNFDIAYGNGIQSDAVENELADKNELEFDIDEQNINIISMYNTHAYHVIHKANVAQPINILKRIFTSKSVRDKINTYMGSDGIKGIFKFINALETGGITTTEFNRSQKRIVNQILSGTARASLGLNLKTYMVNMMSAANILLDTSIPTSIKIKSVFTAFSGMYEFGSKSALDKLIRRRKDAGANALLQIIKSDTTGISPGSKFYPIKQLSDRSLEWIGEIDANFLTFSAIAAYNAHYEIGKLEGLQGEELKLFAENGMVRSITKVAQPNMAATKSYLEQTSNPFFRTISMFMSESRKNLGIEYTVMRKNGILSREFLNIFLFNHLIIGSGAYALRALGGTILGEEDPWDIEEWLMYTLSGPLSGIILFGSAADSLIKKIYNELAPGLGLDKVRVFGPSAPAPIRVIEDVIKLKDSLDKGASLNERADDIATGLESIGTILNQPIIGSAGSILDAITDLVKATVERE
jgi:hypothetical protein